MNEQPFAVDSIRLNLQTGDQEKLERAIRRLKWQLVRTIVEPELGTNRRRVPVRWIIPPAESD